MTICQESDESHLGDVIICFLYEGDVFEMVLEEEVDEDCKKAVDFEHFVGV